MDIGKQETVIKGSIGEEMSDKEEATGEAMIAGCAFAVQVIVKSYRI